jgi:hypothetical protein
MKNTIPQNDWIFNYRTEVDKLFSMIYGFTDEVNIDASVEIGKLNKRMIEQGLEIWKVKAINKKTEWKYIKKAEELNKKGLYPPFLIKE